ncbi:cupin domain-containing protein [Mycolicibacterium sp. 120266]|uniref:cupin domain-containing protein n=1 Tax=Mycolicibacterium sp. 120266 TaxID=3090601 RepID=UPI00299F35AE|nr:cupin domain-containing protein [Mycolicibacterium sp. 120266]MDX1871136.1 cupin domain-containing protein [Mycolicibacterium sp. 120266]
MSAESNSLPTAVRLHHVHATVTELPTPEPKPTSRSNQLESTLDVWSAGALSTGVWECGPGEFTADRSTNTEVCQIISGYGTVTGEDGAAADIGPGSLLVLPRGWRGTWVIRETIRKSFVIVDG